MNLLRPRQNLTLLMLITIGVVLGGGWYAIHSFRKVTELDRIVRHGAAAIYELNLIFSNVQDIEASMRAYSLTRKKAYLRPYFLGINEVWQSVGKMYELLQQENLGESVHSTEWELHAPLNLLERQRQDIMRNRKVLPSQFIQSLHAIEAFRRRVSRTQADIEHVLMRRELEARRFESYFRWSIMLTTLLSAAVMLAAFMRIHRAQKLEREEAIAMNRAKSRFLANMSHEIRTPLAAVLGFADILNGDRISTEERQQCESALRRNGQLLVKIIDEILDLSKVEAQKLEIESVEFDLRELIHDVETVMSLRAAEKGIGLQFNIDPGVKGIYFSDPTRIKQVLFNLVGNAIKFTNHGAVTLAGERTKSGILRFIVQDTGIGMSHEAAERLFEPFTQADSSTERTFGGTGLGLSIARELAAAMGGNVRLLNSKAGEGSKFEITFNFKRKSETTEGVATVDPCRSLELIKPPEVSAWRKKTILVVDDSEDNRSLVEFFLKPTGSRVVPAASGAEALELIARQRFDLILMDIQMPVKNGYETTREVRDHGFTGPIIAFTAHAMRDEVERCKHSGCDGVLTKPITRDALVASLDHYLKPGPAHLDGPSGPGYQITHGRA